MNPGGIGNWKISIKQIAFKLTICWVAPKLQEFIRHQTQQSSSTTRSGIIPST